MKRLLLAGLVALVLVGGAPSVSAQTCTPACGAGKTCIWVGEGTDTECINASVCTGDECEVDEIVITGNSKPKGDGGGEYFKTFINKVATEIVDPLITLLALIAFALFVWGGVMFIKNADNEEKRKAGQMHMLWGIVGLALIFGASAIVNMIEGLAGLG